MSVEHNPSTQSPPDEVAGTVTTEDLPRPLADEAVPLLDPAARELGREREERVRVVVGRRGPRPPRRAVAIIALALFLSVGIVALALAAGGGGGGAPSADAPANPPRRSAAHVRAQTTAVPTDAPRPTHRTGARRRATLAARREAARRRGRVADRRRHRHRHRVNRAPAHHADDRAAQAVGAQAAGEATEGGAETPALVQTAPAVEAAPEPESPPAAEPAPVTEAPAESGSTSKPSPSAAEGEFGFER
jgi:hypothetical protein